jgi:hypothetical protein
MFIFASIYNPASASTIKQNSVSFTNCARLSKVFPQGVALSIGKAKIQKVRPAVNRSVYLKNKKLDRDKDGTACEVSKSQPILAPTNTLPPITVTTPTTTTPTRVCPSGNWRFNVTGLRVTMTIPTQYVGVSLYYFEMVGSFTNSTNAALFPNSMYAKVNFTPNLDNWSRIYPESPADFSLVSSQLSVSPGATAVISGAHWVESSTAPTLGTGHRIRVTWDDPTNVAFCPAPVKE